MAAGIRRKAAPARGISNYQLAARNVYMTKKILITGNMGYVGPLVVNALRHGNEEVEIHGLDSGFFSACLTASDVLPEANLDHQWFIDIRDVSDRLLQNFHTVIYLAAVSNDPIGKEFKSATESINFSGACRFAKLAKQSGVQRFVFASSCSMYGASGEHLKNEESDLAPLTTYAKSKVGYESILKGLADESFMVTALRFATACGMSPRLRLDLVLNDFVASAFTSGKIVLLSNGEAWRPLIDVSDMARAVRWAAQRGDSQDDRQFLPVNVGSSDWNYKIIDLARIVAEEFDGIDLVVGENQADARTYQVDFSLYERLAPDFVVIRDIRTTIAELRNGLSAMGFDDTDFRNSLYMRLKMLQKLKRCGRIDDQLRWVR